MIFAGKKVLVFGTGKSGIAAEELLHKKGASVVLYDGNDKLEKEEILKKLESRDSVEVVLGELPEEMLDSLDLVVLSPGVPTDLPVVLKMKEKEIPVIGEVELAYQVSRGKVLAITGTNGKTTTKELIAAVLQKKYRILYTLGNLNNHIGVPLTLLRLTPDDELAVIEMGANHPGEIKTLSAIVEPDYGIITNVGKAHLEGFGSFEGVIKTKGELYEHLRYGGEHTIFIDRDNEHLNKISKGLTCITYGTEDEAELYVSGKAGICAPFLTFEWRHEDRRHKVSTHLIGSYNLKNALAAIAIGRFFNVSEEDISKALEEYIPHNNRSQLTPTADNNLIVDAYNANPTSMMAALENFRRMEVLHKMVILGDMKELGKSSHEEHQKIVSYIDECKFERVILVGEEFGQATSSYEHYQDARQLSEVLKKSKPKGFYILIKGSNSMKLAPLQELL